VVPTPWHKEKGNAECAADQIAVVKDDDDSVEGCHDDEADADAQIAALYASEEDMTADPVMTAIYDAFGVAPATASTTSTVKFATAPAAEAPASEPEAPAPEFDPLAYSKGLWRGVLAVEGVETGDFPRREFVEGALEWRDVPLSIYWQRVTAPEHDNAVIVARADEVWRSTVTLADGRTVPAIRAHGRFALDDVPEAAEVHGLMGKRFIRGVSVTLDDIEDADVEYIFPETAASDDEEGDELAELFAMPEKVLFHHARITDSCFTGQPALPEAEVELVADADEATIRGDERVESVTAGGFPVAPPSAWFDNPGLDGPTVGAYLDSGRCFGHFATWGVCHLSFAPRMCVTPPQGNDYSDFHHGSLVTAEGHEIRVGQLTVGTIHAPAKLGLAPAIQHYEHTGWVAADVALGEDRHGIWFAGALRPDLTPQQLRIIRASGVSGDWRRTRGGRWHVAGVLVVNVEGFPVPKVRTYTRNGEQTALVAAGALMRPPRHFVPLSVADRIARTIGRDHPSRRAAAAARVRALRSV
jgi:hypothetical protein